MNINSIILKMINFDEYIVDSGFIRDVTEYITAIQQPGNNQNLILLKDVAQKVLEYLVIIEDSDVPNDLKLILPQSSIEAFSPTQHAGRLKNLLSDTERTAAQFQGELLNALNLLKNQLDENKIKLDELYEVFKPYYTEIDTGSNAVMSFIFKDDETITSLKKFGDVLRTWNTTLHIYHQLVSSEQPKDVELINVQNGSLDVVVNLNVDVSINFTEIIKYGMIAFSGYLTYKSRAKEIIETYLGNKKLLTQEKQREKLLLDNIGEAIKKGLEQQHKKLLKKDKKINGESIEKKIERVTNVLSEHIVKGNDIKLLIEPSLENEDENNEEGEKVKTLLDETKKVSLKVRNGLIELSSDDRKLLIEKYTLKEEDRD